MKLGRMIALAKKDWKKMVRDPAVLFMIILFPLVLTIAFGASFGAVGGSQNSTYTIGVVDQGNTTTSHEFTLALSNNSILKVKYFGENYSAQSALSQGRVQGVLILPSNFQSSVQSFKTNPDSPSMWRNATIQLFLDRASLFSSQVVPTIVQQTLDGFLGVVTSTPATPLTLSSPSLVSVATSTVFDQFAPGLFAFASIYLIIMVAGSFTADRESGMLNRILVTPATSSDIMLSTAVSYLAIGLVQVALVFGSAYAMGYHPDASVAGLAMGFVIATIFALCNVGFGLITAAIAKTAGAATGISFLFLLPQLFLGTFVGSALSGGAQAAGRFVPAYYVTDALTSLFTRGASPTSPAVVVDLVVVMVSSVVILIVGILVFRGRSKN